MERGKVAGFPGKIKGQLEGGGPRICGETSKHSCEMFYSNVQLPKRRRRIGGKWGLSRAGVLPDSIVEQQRGKQVEVENKDDEA